MKYRQPFHWLAILHNLKFRIIFPKNCNLATEVTEYTERFKGLNRHAALTRWVKLENDIRSLFFWIYLS